ncbi:MAG: hypothetical protein C0476_03160 [Sphingomonas sp.]|nr:hypothetical protein [Sphingomonas sp.]
MLALAYAMAGVAHLRAPAGFLAITPDWVPAPTLVIAVTGWCELAGAVGLLLPRLRWWAGVALAVYAVGVFPANIKHAVDAVPIGGVVLGPAYHIPRLFLQPVLVWWALWAGEVTDWPWRRRPRVAP